MAVPTKRDGQVRHYYGHMCGHGRVDRQKKRSSDRKGRPEDPPNCECEKKHQQSVERKHGSSGLRLETKQIVIYISVLLDKVSFGVLVGEFVKR